MVSIVVPLTVSSVAVIVVVPAATPVARPVDDIVAFEAAELVQVTCVVTTSVLASGYVAVAMYCWVCPVSMEAPSGVTAIESGVAAGSTTVRVVVPLTESSVALIVVVPVAIAVTRPASLIVATPVSELCHVTSALRLGVLVSE